MKVLFLVNFLTIEGDPMGVMQLSSIAKLKGWKTALAVADDAEDMAIQEKPDLLAVSMMSTGYGPLMGCIRAIRRRFPSMPIVVGGPHPTFYPELVKEPEITAICQGEGERAFEAILDRIEAGQALDGIGNVATRDTPSTLGPLVEDLDTLPFIDRSLIYDKSEAMRRFRLRSFYSSRGCPYRCSYCFNYSYNTLYKGLGKIYRKRSVGSLIAEVNEVARHYPTEYIRFSDDTFILRADDWLRELADRFPKEANIPFYCLLRSNTINAEMVDLLTRAGAKSVCMSIEAANPQVRKEILRRDMTNESIIAAFDAFNAAGVNIYTNCIVGFPNTTIEDDIATLDLAIRCKPSYCGFSIATPFPGTELYEYCEKNGTLPENLSPEDFSSTFKGSLLNCFTDAERRNQKNFVLLAPTVVWMPFLRPLFVRLLMHFSVHQAYFPIQFLVKNYLFMKKIVPLKFTAKDVLVLGANQMRMLWRLVFGGRKAEPGKA